MFDTRAAQPLGDVPLPALVADAEEGIRLVAERLGQDDPEVAALLAEIRIKLLVATARLSDE